MQGCGLSCGVDAQLFGQQPTAAIICAQRLGWISRRRVHPHEQLMHPFPKRFERDRLLGSAHRKLVPAALGITFTEHTQRPQQHLAQTVADTIDPPPPHIREKRTRSDHPGKIRERYRPLGMTIAQHLFRSLHSGTGTLDIDHHIGRQMKLVGTETTISSRASRQPGGGQECANLADHTAQGSVPGARQSVGPQCLSELVTGNRTVTLHHQQRKKEPGLTPIKKPLINDRISRLHRHPASKLDPHRREIELSTNAGHAPRPGIRCDQPPQPVAVH